jgi:recombinational DNA repair protein RecR
MAQIEPIATLVANLAKLPGIGRKTAQRLAYHILSMPQDEVRQLAEAVWQAKKRTHACAVCGNYTDSDACDICRDATRDTAVICVVRDPRDVAAMERSTNTTGCTMYWRHNFAGGRYWAGTAARARADGAADKRGGGHFGDQS